MARGEDLGAMEAPPVEEVLAVPAEETAPVAEEAAASEAAPEA
jgi:hypothetical protein